MQKNKVTSALWKYLEASGSLAQNNPERIKEAKKQYKRIQDRERKRRSRSLKREHVIALEPREEARLKKEAQVYGLSEAMTLKHAAYAYFDKAYLIPDKTSLYRVEALIRRAVTDVGIMAKHDKSWLSGHRDYAALSKLLIDLFNNVKEEYSKPRQLETAIFEALTDNPKFLSRLEYLLERSKNKATNGE